MELGHEALEMKLWVALVEAGLLVGPGLSKVLAFFAIQLMVAQVICSLPILRRPVQVILAISASVLVMLR